MILFKVGQRGWLHTSDMNIVENAHNNTLYKSQTESLIRIPKDANNDRTNIDLVPLVTMFSTRSTR